MNVPDYDRSPGVRPPLCGSCFARSSRPCAPRRSSSPPFRRRWEKRLPRVLGARRAGDPPPGVMPGSRPQPFEDFLDPGVRGVEVMLTTGCNLRCAYCSQQRRAPRTVAPEILDAAIRQLVSRASTDPGLILFGGEPLLAAPLVRRALERVRRWAPRRMKPDVRIVTNGTRLDEALTRLLVSRDVFITLSFDGVSPAQDDRGPGSFEVLDPLLVRLRRNHPRHFRKRLGVKATLTSRNVPFLSASFRYFLSRGVRAVEFVPVLPDDVGWNTHVARELDRQLTGVVELSVEEFRRSGEIPLRPFRAAAAAPEADGARACACGSRGLLFVDVDGTLAPCAAFAPSTFGEKREASPSRFRSPRRPSRTRPGASTPLSVRRERRAQPVPLPRRSGRRGRAPAEPAPGARYAPPVSSARSPLPAMAAAFRRFTADGLGSGHAFTPRQSVSE